MSENIQVIVRVRARNRAEIAAKSPIVVQLPSDEGSTTQANVTISNSPNSVLSGRLKNAPAAKKTYVFDQSYGPNADQALIFQNVAMPLFNDFKAGQNVTILAYGQTGSGKTYTMFGDLEGEHAGIIPRLLSDLFATPKSDYMVKLACVELYNEELYDLIADESPGPPQKSKLRLGLCKDTQTTVIHNRREVNVDSSEMGFNILKRCLRKRKTSATKLNDMSSRSHTMVSISLWQKRDDCSDGDQYMKSTINLVDLAGSEDINKSGAVNQRAREAGSINQSLLSLGKVISALSEEKDHRHIPYRESKLTRILESSLGGSTKTALISTISPAEVNVVETISTLNYASKAKNIKNLPQTTLDSKIVYKDILVKDLSASYARLQRDYFATVDKDGNMKVSMQTYQEIEIAKSEQKTVEKEKNAHIKKLAAQLHTAQQELADSHRKNSGMEARIEKLEKESKLKDARISELNDKAVVSERLASEQQREFAEMENHLRSSLDRTLADARSLLSSNVTGLTDKVDGHKQAIVASLEKARESVSRSMANFAAQFGPERKKEIVLQLQQEMNISDEFEKIPRLDLDQEVSKSRKAEEAAVRRSERAFLLETHADSTRASQAQMKVNLDSLIESVLAGMTHMLTSKLGNFQEETSRTISEYITSVLATGSKMTVDAFSSLANEHVETTKTIASKVEKQRKEYAEVQKSLISKRDRAGSKIYEEEERRLQRGLATVTQHHSDACKSSVAVVNECMDDTTKAALAANDSFGKKLDVTTKSVSQPLSEITETNVSEPRRSPHRKQSLLIRSPGRGALPEPKRRKSMSPTKVDPMRFPSRIPSLLHRK